MQSRLIVKNFGPIEFVDLDLRNVNVFIGPQASGKSALAKLFTIFKAPRKFLNNSDGSIKRDSVIAFKDVLEEYNITSFIKSNTAVEFDSELHTLSYINDSITYKPKLLSKIQYLEQFKENVLIHKEEIKNKIIELSKDFILIELIANNALSIVGEPQVKPNQQTKEHIPFKNLDNDNFSIIIDKIKELELNLSTNAAVYIPSERNFINIIKNASLNLLLNNVPIPKHILSFGAEIEKATIKEIDLSFLHKDLVYKSINGEDHLFTDSGHSIKLLEAASGIQSVVPILIPIMSHFGSVLPFQHSFVIEEPELNLFPLAQYELIKLLESNRLEAYWEDYGSIHTYTTHSPYILSALNNLLYANKVLSTKREGIKDKVSSIIPASVNPDYFTAYQVSDGGAQSIFDREKGLIIDNYIDDASDEMADDFDALMELMK